MMIERSPIHPLMNTIVLAARLKMKMKMKTKIKMRMRMNDADANVSAVAMRLARETSPVWILQTQANKRSKMMNIMT